MVFPVGTRFNKWSLHPETQKGKRVFVIRRWAVLPSGQRKIERLSVEKYRTIRENEAEMKLFLIRLNEQSKELRTKEAVIIKHAFISPAMLDTYRDYLITQIPSRHKAVTEFAYLTKYFLNYFIGKLNLPDPLEWHKVHDSKWADYLVSEEAPAAADTKKIIIYAANRFMGWLHKQRPAEVPPLIFKPFTKAKFKQIEAVREMNGEIHKSQMIKDSDWKIIQSNKGLTWVYSQLGYKFGLRRAEVLGLKVEDVRKAYLSVERQLVSFNGEPVYGPLKGREKRKVPYWFSSPEEAYLLIEQIQLIHPDTLTDRFADLINELNLSYSFHDLRHTFITKAIRLEKPRDVQLAVGHKDITTTMGYVHDDRELEDEAFIPKRKIS